MAVEVAVFRDFGKDAELIKFLGCDICQHSLFNFHIFSPEIILSELKVISEPSNLFLRLNLPD